MAPELRGEVSNSSKLTSAVGSGGLFRSRIELNDLNSSTIRCFVGPLSTTNVLLTCRSLIGDSDQVVLTRKLQLFGEACFYTLAR
jgi:hypothetical protein